MLKLFIIISLSLLCSCGPKITSGPDAILVAANTPSGKNNKEIQALTMPEISILSIFDIEEDKNLKAIDPLKVSDRFFFNQYRNQYMEQSHKSNFTEVADSFFYSRDRASKHLVRMIIKNFMEIETLVLRVYNPEQESSFKLIRLGSNELQQSLIEFELDLTTMANSSMIAIKVEDFDYTYKGREFNHLQVKKELNREHYNLIIENSKNRVKGIVPTSLNLKQALDRLNIKHSHNSFGKITNMLGHPSSSKEVEIWNYPDHVGFWELINTPSQTLNYFPLGGETILIKWITVKDIRENVFRKEIEIIELNSPVINLQWAGAIRLEVHDISLDLKVARQAQERITANQTYFISRSSRERDWLEKEKGRCSINRYKSQWESKPIKDPLLAVKTKDLVIGKSHLVASDNRIKKIDLGLVTPSIVIKEGHTNINCKRDAKVSAGGSVRFGLKSKLHTPRYSGSAKIIKYYSY